jgi:hypothetical protein
MTDRYELYTFNMADVEDPDLFVSAPIYEWQQTPEGKFCMKNASDIKYHISPDDHSYGYKVKITGNMKDKYLTWLTLKKT